MTELRFQEVLALLDISMALLIFGVGLPSLIFDRPAHLRRILERSSKISKHAPTITTFILTAIVIWFGIYLFDPYILPWCTQPSYLVIVNLCGFRELILQHFDVISPWLIVIGVSLTVWLWVILRNYRFHYILRRLEKELRGVSLSARARQIMKRISPQFRLDRPSRFESLGVLGQNTVIQDDKKAVLDTLKVVRTQVPFDSNTYIEETNQFVDAVLATLESANEGNHILGITILSGFAEKLGQDNSNQLPKIVDGMMYLGVKEVGFDPFQIHQHLLRTFQTLRLFEQCESLCTVALRKKQYGSAIGFIHVLENEAGINLNSAGSGDNPDDERNPIIHYIGAIAYSLAVGGEFSKWAEEGLLMTFGDDRPRLREWCDRTVSYYLDIRADFVTAHHIRQRIITSLCPEESSAA